MINLLPTDVKQTITYARRNTKLRRWIIVLFISILFVCGIVASGYVYMHQSANVLKTQISQGEEQLKKQKLAETQKRVQDLSSTLKLVVQVLSRQILFSKLLSQTGAALPNGSILTQLSINELQGGLDLSVAANNYQTATQVQINLEDPKNKIFEKADILSIQCAAGNNANESSNNPYPCTVQLRALFAKNNPFLFIAKEVKP